MAEKIEFLLARGFRGIERGVLGGERLQLAKPFLIIGELLLRAGERIEKIELPVRRKQGLVIMRAMKIDQRVADAFQDRQRGRRTVNELAIRSGRGKCSLDNQIIATWFDSGLDQLRV